MQTKIILFVFLSLLSSAFSEDQVQGYFENPLLIAEKESHANLVYGIQTYLSPVATAAAYPEYSWQFNIQYVDEPYRPLVKNIIYSKPISQWPLVIRYLVYPQVYGYYTTTVLSSYLAKLKEHVTVVEKGILDEGFDVKSIEVDLSQTDKEKLDLLEQLSRLESLKKEVDHNLILQTQQLLEAKKYGEQVEKLLGKLKNYSSDAEDIDKILKTPE